MINNNWIYITESMPTNSRYKTVAIRVEGYYCDYTYQTLAFYSKKKDCWYDYKKNKIKDYVFAWKNGSAEKDDDPDFDSDFMCLPKEMFPEVTWETGLKMVELKIKE